MIPQYYHNLDFVKRKASPKREINNAMKEEENSRKNKYIHILVTQ